MKQKSNGRKTISQQDRLVIYTTGFYRRYFDGITVKNGKKHKKMEQALNVLTDNTTTELLYGGAAGGAKSFTGCYWLLMTCLAYPGVRVFVARNRYTDLIETTLKTFMKVAQELGLGDIIQYNDKYKSITLPTGSEIKLIPVAYKPTDPDYTRIGSSEYTIGWFEEAGETAYKAYEILSTRVGRHLNDRYNLSGKLLITANPTKNWVYTTFYTNRDEDKAFIQSFIDDNPFIDKEYKKRLDNMPEGNSKARLLRGEWEYDDDPTALIEYDALINMFDEYDKRDDGKYLICDIARDGGDKITAFVFDGLQLVEANYWTREKTNVSAKMILRIAMRHAIPPSRVLIDANGLGVGVADQLPNGVVEFINNARPINNDNYKSLKDQCGYMLANVVNNKMMGLGGCKIEPEDKQLIIQEFEWLKSFEDEKQGKARLLPKDEIKEAIGRSPDFLDTFIMRMYYEINKTYSKTTKHTTMNNLYDYRIDTNNFVNTAWYFGDNGRISVWFFQLDRGRINVLDYLSKEVATPSEIMLDVRDMAMDKEYVLNKSYLHYIKVNEQDNDPRADIYKLLKKLGPEGVKIMPRVTDDETLILIRDYFDSLEFKYPETQDGYYQVQNDVDIDSEATRALIPLIQATCLRGADAYEVSVNSMKDVRLYLHSDDVRMRRKAEKYKNKIK